MNCNFNLNNGCNCNSCKNIVTSTSIKLLGDVLTLIIPDMSLCNGKCVCIKIGQSLPIGITSNTIVLVQVGLVPRLILTSCIGNFLYADQISSCKIYCFKFATDTQVFLYKGGWRLCQTKHIFGCIPITAVAKLNNDVDINSMITDLLLTKTPKVVKPTKKEE